MKTIEQNFVDWEGEAFGFGYGTGEPHTIKALHDFLALCHGEIEAYDYKEIEKALTPTAAWLMINALCKQDMITYGTSPRYGWLTDKGITLRKFVLDAGIDKCVHIVCNRTENDIPCYKSHCNCPDEPCSNPFWKN